MIRLALLVLAGFGVFLLAKGNADNTVIIHFLTFSTPPLAVHWLLFYTFLGGAVAFALFSLPERIKTWNELRKHERSLRKMGKNLSNVISSAASVPK